MHKKNSIKKRKSFLLLISIFIIIFSFSVFSQFYRFSLDLDRNKEKSPEFENLKIHGQEINITTPENKTYTEPMSGYYPATYGFENDENGKLPEGWDDESTGTSQVYTVSDKDGHYKVIKIDDDGSTNYGQIKNSLNPTQTNGTIDYWIYKESGNGAAKISLRNVTSSSFFEIRIDVNNNGKFEYTGAVWTEFGTGYSDNTWFQLSIDFECGSGGYKGLSPDHVHIYLNGERVASDIPFLNQVDSLSEIWLYAAYTDRDAILYYDAIGYSWDPNYSIGDNMNEGLLVSYTNSTNLDWKGYSLDGQTNKTILGNTTIPLPDSGIHTIQVFGNDSIGTMFESYVRYFAVDSQVGPTPGPEPEPDPDPDPEPTPGDKNIDLLLIIILVSIIALIGVVVIGIIYSKVYIPSKKPSIEKVKPKKEKIKTNNNKKRIQKTEFVDEIVNCPFCHSEISSAQKFCKFCGANLKEERDL